MACSSGACAVVRDGSRLASGHLLSSKREIHEGFHIAENWIRSKFVFFGKVVNWRQIAFTNKKFRQWLYAESRGLAPLIKAYTNKTFIKTRQSFTSAR
ncbi:hypothetical protein DEA98_26785 [Brucella pseudogrignonensis]|nr:hypothetical protein [Brucella pseudogrignonensis]